MGRDFLLRKNNIFNNSGFILEWNNERSDKSKDDNKKGVNLLTCYKKETGLGESCRLTAKALGAADINFKVKGFEDLNSNLWTYENMDQLIYNTNIFHVNPKETPYVHKWLGKAFCKERYNIGYWYWELMDFPDEWIKAFDYLDEVWTSSKFTLNSIKEKSPVPVKLIPPCIKVDSIGKVTRKDFNLPQDAFLFLTMYDSWSYKIRKNPQGAIDSFKAAFSPDDMSVGLVIKINNANSNPGEVNNLIKSLKGYKNIYLIKEILSRSDVNALISMCDCFVSLHRSEGFGLAMAEAMYLGLPVIATNWSGNLDFMNHENSCLVDYELVKIGKDLGPYKAYQTWAKPDNVHCAYSMKELILNRNYYDKIAQNGKETIRSLYSPERIGKMIKDRLEDLKLL